MISLNSLIHVHSISFQKGCGYGGSKSKKMISYKVNDAYVQIHKIQAGDMVVNISFYKTLCLQAKDGQDIQPTAE